MRSEVATPVDVETLERKYAQERAKRLRADGNDQFSMMTGSLAEFAADPYVAPLDREPIEDDVDAVVLGAGFGGLLLGGRLREAGLGKICMIDKAGDVGGTWYWNRYPGVQCDVESYIYLPLLEETGYVPKEKYSYGPEIREHAKRVAEFFGLYDGALFQTAVTQLEWDEGRARWLVQTDRGDRIRARYVAGASGPLQRPKLPGVPGLQSFRGKAFHTSRWDYETTGSEQSRLAGLADKRVGVIGTGATSVQIVPRIAESARQLFVFQRTPSAVAARNNRPTDPEWWKTLEPGWARRRRENFNNLTTGRPEPEDLVDDEWTALTKQMMRIAASAPAGKGEALRLMNLADHERMQAIRDRVATIVENPETAEALQPYYRYHCKRPCFHDEFLAAFNRPNVTLVDTQGRGVERITERGCVVDGREVELDCLIYATGFDVVGDFTSQTQLEAIGRGGKKLSDHWREGPRTLHSFISDDFPNLFLVSISQGAQSFNYTHMADEVATHIAHLVDHMERRGLASVAASAEAVDRWGESILKGAKRYEAMQRGCTPGYYNNEGDFDRFPWRKLPFHEGSGAFFELLAQWRDAGEFQGLEFRTIE